MAKLKKSTSAGPRGNRTIKTLACQHCGNDVDNVDQNATAVTCWRCVSRLCSGVPVHKLKLKEDK
jgi:hypothetical protein